MNIRHIASIIIFSLYVFLTSSGCSRSPNKKEEYELQEQCGRRAEQWAKAHNDVINYTAHYSSRLNKCFVLATLSSIVSDGFSTSITVLYEVNENKEYGHATMYLYENAIVGFIR